MSSRLDMEHALDIIKRDGMICHLCKLQVALIYKPRDSKQFTLDRIDNKKGHIIGNVLIACYSCNLLRSNVYSSEQFRDTFF